MRYEMNVEFVMLTMKRKVNIKIHIIKEIHKEMDRKRSRGTHLVL